MDQILDFQVIFRFALLTIENIRCHFSNTNILCILGNILFFCNGLRGKINLNEVSGENNNIERIERIERIGDGIVEVATVINLQRAGKHINLDMTAYSVSRF